MSKPRSMPEVDLLNTMEESLRIVPTPPNKEKQQLIKEMHNLRENFVYTISKFKSTTAMLADRFIKLANREIEQSTKDLATEVNARMQELTNVKHLENLSKRLEESSKQFVKTGQAKKLQENVDDTSLPSPISMRRLFAEEHKKPRKNRHRHGKPAPRRR